MDLKERANKYQGTMAAKVVAAKVNNLVVDLNYPVRDNDRIELIDISSIEGIRVYRNTLNYVLIKAVDELFDHVKIKINYSMNKGGYCQLEGIKIDKHVLKRIRGKMNEIIALKLPIEKNEFSKEEAKTILCRNHREDRVKMLEYIKGDTVTLYHLNGVYDYFYGVLAIDTSYVDIFDLKLYDEGFILLFPDRFNPGKLPEFKDQLSLSKVFKEYKEWGKILGVDNIVDINNIVSAGEIMQLILISEALQEKKIAYIADNIKTRHKKFVFIAGPSSSGKTTFANRLLIQLKANGLNGTIISLDNYYRGFGKIPYDINGELDYESILGLDLDLLRKNVLELMNTGKTEIPVYDFTEEKVIRFNPVDINEQSIIVFEGIHGLNPMIYENMDEHLIHKIYISALTSINIDDHNRFSSTDTRLIRRIVRDFNYRSASASRTLKMWPSVRRGEDKSIFPFQDGADDVFNSSLIYEHGVLKKYALKVLQNVDINDEYYSEAKRLAEILQYFEDIDDSKICISSILREFIGGTVFQT
ncbi:MAG: nucleoside kinase [Clostridia bacterium]|nr:nucleoside kinase [Clostridia bacterium]